MKTKRDTNVMFFHGVTTDGNRFTMAGTIVSNKTLSIGLAICNQDDKFTKEIGRNISYGRSVTQKSPEDIRGRKHITIPSNVDRVSTFFYNIASGYCKERKRELIIDFDLIKHPDLPF